MDRELEDYPKAYVISSRPYSTGTDEQITIDCPLCPHQHHHGGYPGKRGMLGHKSAHCWSPYAEANSARGESSYVVYDNRPLDA